ncbi:ABC transporter permease [Georgenia faecalis]|uniref:ABC transporter permease n=1 Tax=Georgenia faecalis TaxID=2483799 RepID=UPI000FD8A24F|nr:ABC transporter permease [Georgenia faecalis]
MAPTTRPSRPSLTYRGGGERPRPLSGVAALGLVFRRELLARLQSRAFLLSTGFLAALSFAAPFLVGPDGGSTGMPEGLAGLLLTLGVGAAIVLVVALWGATLATGVVDEKASRVVEILLACIRPWPLLIGKVLAVSLLGLTQFAVLALTAVGGLAASGSPVPSLGLPVAVLPVGLLCLVLGVVLFSVLMAGLAARVERQEDLSPVLQPAYGLTLAPFAAVVFLAFDAPDGPWLDVASMVPFFTVFALPVRMALETVPLWQQGLSLAVTVATIVGISALSGRIYGNAILRSGGKVGLRESLRAA